VSEYFPTGLFCTEMSESCSVMLRTIFIVTAIAAFSAVFASRHASANWREGSGPGLVVGFYGFSSAFVGFPYAYGGPTYGGCYYQWDRTGYSSPRWRRELHCVGPGIVF
jgi:hypothetical protein